LDKLALELYAQAFSRPAFQDPFNNENPEDFLQAIGDTMRALNTGELLDRQTRHATRPEIGGERLSGRGASSGFSARLAT